MKFTVITVFPQIIEAFVAQGLLGQARDKGLVEVDTLNPRAFTSDVHQTVDDRAFGGGDGMVMKVEPLAQAVRSLKERSEWRVAVLTPQGRPWTQMRARDWAAEGRPTALVCGRYAGIDQRFSVLHADEEISIGDFVLNGGEVAACAIIESVARLRPGVLGNQRSADHDSFGEEGILECPQFTRPREVEGLSVPEPLLSGHHARIRDFEHAVAVVRTCLLRPDLARSKNLAKGLSKALARVRELSENELQALGLTPRDLSNLENFR